MTKSPTTTAAAAPATAWPEFAATYRRAVASYLEAIKVDTPEAQERANEGYDRAFSALLDYPLATPAELAEKVELVFLVEAGPDDFEKIEATLKRDAAAVRSFTPVVRGRGRDLTHDLIAYGCTVEPSAALRTWLDRETAWTATVSAMNLDATDEALDAEAAAWADLIRTQAPSLRALLTKIEMVLVCNGDIRCAKTVETMAANMDPAGSGPQVFIWRDLQRLLGVSELAIPAGA